LQVIPIRHFKKFILFTIRKLKHNFSHSSSCRNWRSRAMLVTTSTSDTTRPTSLPRRTGRSRGATDAPCFGGLTSMPTSFRS
jgi:hypothetical protein